jgi:hypothetical protein
MKGWLIFLISIIPNLILGMIIIYGVALFKYGKINTYLSSGIIAAQLGQCIGSSIFGFGLASRFYKSRPSELISKNPEKQTKNNNEESTKIQTESLQHKDIINRTVNPLVNTTSNQKKEIELKEKLLFNSLQGNLISDSEFVEKSNQLKAKKKQILDFEQEEDLKKLAFRNLKNKLDQLKELLNQGLLNEGEYKIKSDNLVSSEIERLKNVPDIGYL